ncbi:hypothetical protein BV20DRAFT_983099 [Pilatotrama ljubarskyi]|nr:hypothetical protein BV20DRAFT_983099 [Pilatotrama ljubarskyi]
MSLPSDNASATQPPSSVTRAIPSSAGFTNPSAARSVPADSAGVRLIALSSPPSTPAPPQPSAHSPPSAPPRPSAPPPSSSQSGVDAPPKRPPPSAAIDPAEMERAREAIAERCSGHRSSFGIQHSVTFTNEAEFYAVYEEIHRRRQLEPPMPEGGVTFTRAILGWWEDDDADADGETDSDGGTVIAGESSDDESTKDLSGSAGSNEVSQKEESDRLAPPSGLSAGSSGTSAVENSAKAMMSRRKRRALRASMPPNKRSRLSINEVNSTVEDDATGESSSSNGKASVADAPQSSESEPNNVKAHLL